MTPDLHPRLADLIADVEPVDEAARAEAGYRWDQLAKPPGSLGRLERLATQIAAITRSPIPTVPARPGLLVCAADHGVHAQDVTPWPQSVTTAMVQAMAAGTATCNAFARAVGATVTVLDVGCAEEPADAPGLRKARVRAGTADLSVGPAMGEQEAIRAVLAGANTAEEMLLSGTDLLVLGDMGMANTTASAALVATFTGRTGATVAGPGAGADPDRVRRKAEIIDRALRRIPADAHPVTRLAEVGGLEHAALVGAMLAAAAAHVPVILDGLISDAAALVAVALQPAVAEHLVAGHRSTEPAASLSLEALGDQPQPDLQLPLLDLQLRLGEGTGALLAVPLVRAAVAALSEVALISDLTA